MEDDKGADEGNNVDLHGVSFAPPSNIDKVVPRDPKPKEPITKRGKRLAEAREKVSETASVRSKATMLHDLLPDPLRLAY